MAKNDTLCWDCKFATGGCPWVDKWQPVPGWEATKTKVFSYSNYDKKGKPNHSFYESYIVTICPIFKDNSFRKERLEFKAKHGIKNDSTFFNYVELGLIDVKGNLLVSCIKTAITKINQDKKIRENQNGL